MADQAQVDRSNVSFGKPLRVGYVSLTATQMAAGMSDPHNALIASGVDRLYIDMDMGQGATPQLDCAFGDLAEGDVLVSPSLETLTRSVSGLMDIHHRLDAIGATLLVLQLSRGLKLDTGTPEGRAILGAVAVMNLLPAPPRTPLPTTPLPMVSGAPVAEPPSAHRAAERMLADRQLHNRPRGRPATAGSQAHEVTRLRAEGLRAVEIAACLGIGRASVYRILSQVQQDGDSLADGQPTNSNL